MLTEHIILVTVWFMPSVTSSMDMSMKAVICCLLSLAVTLDIWVAVSTMRFEYFYSGSMMCDGDTVDKKCETLID